MVTDDLPHLAHLVVLGLAPVTLKIDGTLDTTPPVSEVAAPNSFVEPKSNQKRPQLVEAYVCV